MFEIEVFSDPLFALKGGSVSGTADEIRTYDEDLIKPAIMLADHVLLKSHRLDLQLEQQLELQMSSRRVPTMKYYAALSKSRDIQALGTLSLRQSDLLTEGELKVFDQLYADEIAHGDQQKAKTYSTDRTKFLAEKAQRDAVGESIFRRWDYFWDRSEVFRRALTTYFSDRVQNLQSSGLLSLRERGLLEEEPWDMTPRSRPRQVIDQMQGDGTAFERAYSGLVDAVASSARTVMLDDRVHQEVSRLGDKIGGLDTASTVRGAVELMRMVQGISALPLDELADVRADLSEYIGPFRSFMLDVSSGIPSSGVGIAERSRQLTIAWEREVAPAIAEMNAHVRSASFVRNAIDVFGNSGDQILSIGLAVGTLSTAGFVGFSSFAAIGAPFPSVLRAFIGSVKAKRDVGRDRAYFVHALSRTKEAQRALRAQ